MAPAHQEDLEAWLYTLLHTGNAGDTAFYRAACDGASRVLELGSGAGRILVEVARAGAHVTGVELHAGMARRAAARLAAEGVSGARLIQADMSRVELGEHFDRVLIPYNGLLCLVTADDQRACLARCARHLDARGALYFDVYRPPKVGAAEIPAIRASGDKERHLVSIEEGGARIDVFERDVWDPPSQRVDAIYEFVIAERGRVRRVSQTIPQRYLYLEEIDALLDDAGLRRDGTWGGFEGEPLVRGSEHIVVRAVLGGA